MRGRTLCIAVLGALVLFQQRAEAASFGVWSEWRSYPEVRERLPELSQRAVRLHLAIRKDEISDPQTQRDLAALLVEASRLRVEVWFWPLLSRSEGYWLNQWNATAYVGFVRSLLRWVEQQGLTFHGVSMDLEPPPEKLEEFLGAASRGHFGRLRSLARANRDESLLNQSKTEIAALSRELHSLGLQTHAVTTPFLLEDSPEHPLMGAALGIPLDADAYNFVSFMAYRSEYERLLGRMNARLVYDTARKASARFGSKAAIDLGVVGDIEFPHPLQGYTDPSRLWEDIAAARAGGIERIQVYCLDGMDARPWLSDQKPKVPWPSAKQDLLEFLLQLFQALIRP